MTAAPRQRPRRIALLALALTLLALAVGSCVPTQVVGPSVPLLGDPDGLALASLSDDGRLWYDQLLASMENPRLFPDAVEIAAEGDLYGMARLVNVHVSLVLTVFRATGDLRLLDHIDGVMEAARGSLQDSDGDGYANWRWLLDEDSEHYGRDVHKMDEILTHSMIAAVAWAYQNNRHLVSPSGIPYGRRADFWRRYLTQTWEPKWRARSRTLGGVDFIGTELTHPYIGLIRYHWYAYRLTGRSAYLAEAERLYATLEARAFRAVETPDGPALVWTHLVSPTGPGAPAVQATNYARYTAMAMLDLALEPFAPISIEGEVVPFTRSITAFVIDDGTDGFASTIAGEALLSGLRKPASATRRTPEQWAFYPFAAFAAWDESEEIRAVSEQVFRELENGQQETRISIPAGIVLDELLGARSAPD